MALSVFEILIALLSNPGDSVFSLFVSVFVSILCFGTLDSMKTAC